MLLFEAAVLNGHLDWVTASVETARSRQIAQPHGRLRHWSKSRADGLGDFLPAGRRLASGSQAHNETGPSRKCIERILGQCKDALHSRNVVQQRLAACQSLERPLG